MISKFCWCSTFDWKIILWYLDLILIIIFWEKISWFINASEYHCRPSKNWGLSGAKVEKSLIQTLQIPLKVHSFPANPMLINVAYFPSCLTASFPVTLIWYEISCNSVRLCNKKFKYHDYRIFKAMLLRMRVHLYSMLPDEKYEVYIMSVWNNLIKHFLFYKTKRKLVVHALFSSGFVHVFRLKKRERLRRERQPAWRCTVHW